MFPQVWGTSKHYNQSFSQNLKNVYLGDPLHSGKGLFCHICKGIAENYLPYMPKNVLKPNFALFRRGSLPCWLKKTSFPLLLFFFFPRHVGSIIEGGEEATQSNNGGKNKSLPHRLLWPLPDFLCVPQPATRGQTSLPTNHLLCTVGLPCLSCS